MLRSRASTPCDRADTFCGALPDPSIPFERDHFPRGVLVGCHLNVRVALRKESRRPPGFSGRVLEIRAMIVK